MRLQMVAAVASSFTFGSDPSTYDSGADTSCRIQFVTPGTGAPWADPPGACTVTAVKYRLNAPADFIFFSTTSAGVLHAKTGLYAQVSGVQTTSGLSLAVPAGGSVGMWFSTGYQLRYYSGGSTDSYYGSTSLTSATEPTVGQNLIATTGVNPQTNFHFPMLCTAI